MKLYCSVLVALVLLVPHGAADAVHEIEVPLRPVGAFLDAHGRGLSLPFYQAVPVARGALFAPEEKMGISSSGRSIPAQALVAAHWPDGSAQWVSVSGVWPADAPLGEGTVVHISPVPSSAFPAPSWVVRPEGTGIAISDAAGKRLAMLAPEASVIRIVQPKAPVSRDPEHFDTVVQYSWAEELDRLNPDGTPVELQPRATEFIIEAETPASILYRVRGDSGDDALGSGLEWQLRVRVFRQTPVIRFQMTWFFHWDPAEVALTTARWTATLDDTLLSTSGAGQSFVLDQGAVSLSNSAPGRSRVVQGNSAAFEAEWPDPNLHTWLARTAGATVGVGLPNFTRLGPNRLTFSQSGFDVCCWDGQSGLGLDLRNTLTEEDFSVADADIASNGQGVARTVEMTWAIYPETPAAEATVRAEVARDGLWFPNREDLIRSQALGPWQEGAFERNPVYVEDLAARIHWLMASRDHWRWNGFINFGDIRTNWSRAGYKCRDKQILRVYPLRWGLDGRYGWRNGSGEPYRGFLVFGLWAEERDILLFAFDYARHVADVDVMHGRFGQPLVDHQGGMHRRNKNHWTGSVQMQYTPSRGLYLAKWLTGCERFDETLAEIRDYSKRYAWSVFAASSWLDRYTETRKPEDLATAKELLEQTVKGWEQRNQEHEEHRDLQGMAALHAGNFRKALDWWPIQIDFHRATDDPLYLDVLAERVEADPMANSGVGALHLYYPIAYLMAHDRAKGQVLEERIERFRGILDARRHGAPPPREQWSYESLEGLTRVSVQTFELSLRAAFAPLVLGRFERSEKTDNGTGE